MYGVSGLPHVEFGGYIESVGGGGDMYPTYLSRYNQLVNNNSPLSISSSSNISNCGNNIIVEAEINVTSQINTTNNQIIFITSHKYDDDYFCTVGSYSQESFSLTNIGQSQTYEHLIPINQNWDLDNMKVVVLIQSMQNRHILQASSSDISLDNLLVLNPALNSIQNDNDLDGMLNPGESATLSFTIENNSNLLLAENVNVSIDTDAPIELLNNQFYIDDLMSLGESQSFNVDIIVDNNVELGEEIINIAVNADYEDNYGDACSYQMIFPIMVNINLNQVNWPVQNNSQIVSSPSIVDIDNDGSNDIIFGDYNGFLHVIDKNGNSLYGFPFEANDDIWASPAVGDVDNDGLLEIVITSKDKRLYILDHQGNVELNYNANQFLMATPVLSQMDQDPELEIVFSGYSSSGDVFAINHDGTDLIGFPASINEKVLNGAAVTDINDNGLDDIVVATETQDMVCMIYDDGQIDTLMYAQDKFKSSPSIIKSSFGEDWILIASKDHNLYALDFSGNVKFVYTTLYELTSSPSIVDINSNTIGIFFGGQDGHLYGIDQNGEDLLGWPIQTGGQYTTSPSIADLDNDGEPEIICGNSSGDLYAFNLDGTLLNYFPIEYSNSVSTTPVIKDLDGDGDLEIFIGVTDVISGIDIKEVGSNLDYWNMYRANLHRNGTYNSNYTGSCAEPNAGDLNCDGIFDVIDIINLVEIILVTNEVDQYAIWAADLNNDSIIDIFDIILLINLILY